MKHFSLYAVFLIGVFTLAYLVLSIGKYNQFLAGYDLAIVNQIMWKYSVFHAPITTIHAYSFTSIFTDHIEFIYVFLSPLFWVWNDTRMLIGAQAIFFCLSGIPVYLLSRRKGLNELLSLTLLLSYLFFFGVQNAIWNDVHSNVFGAGFLMWFIYFLESGNSLWLWISFFFTITAKEDMALLTFVGGIIWLIKNIIQVQKKSFKEVVPLLRNSLLVIFFSTLYLFLIFVVYFPHFTHDGYRFSSHQTLTQSLTISHFANTAQKREIIAYSLAWFGFLPLFAPLYLLGWFADLFHYFVVGYMVDTAQEIFLHYRVTLAPLLVWPTIITLSTLLQMIKKRLHYWEKYIQLFFAMYLLLCAFAIQYVLHLPLSYLAKSWFWQSNPSVISINVILNSLPQRAEVVTQNNIAPHLGHRDFVFTLWPDTKEYKNSLTSLCGKTVCAYFRWDGNPTYLLVDTSPNWDIRHLLQNRPDFIEALTTLEKLHKVQLVKRDGTTTLYKILQKP